MSKLLKVIGIIWAAIGALNIISMFVNVGTGHETLAAFGLIFNFVLFIVPGLGLAGVGALLNRKNPDTQPDKDTQPGEDTQSALSRMQARWRGLPVYQKILLVLAGIMILAVAMHHGDSYRINQMAESGYLTTSSLQEIGLTYDELERVLHMPAANVREAFRSLDKQSRKDLLNLAREEKGSK
jgi:hypothetical protein